MQMAVILLVPLLGTVSGSFMVFFIKKELNAKFEKILLGFASGVMIAASVWSLLIPSIEMAEDKGVISWIPAVVGFLAGIGFLLILDSIIPHLHRHSDKPEGMKSGLSKTVMLILAVTLHNLPEGMAVGISFAGSQFSGSVLTFAAALSLAVGIAIQNFPEGAIISMPLIGTGMSKKKAFGYGVMSGVVEPIGAMITIILAEQFIPVIPYFLSFAAGAMIYVVVEELIPESQNGEHSNLGTIGAALGFAMMMVLDTALG